MNGLEFSIRDSRRHCRVDQAIHQTRNAFCKRGWIRGSSPRMTSTCTVSPHCIIKTDPRTVGETAPAGLRKRHIPDAGGEVGAERRVRREMAQEILPADPVGINIWPRPRRFLPARSIVDGEVDRRIERRYPRGIGERLHVTAV